MEKHYYMVSNLMIEFITFYLLFWWVMTIINKDNFASNKLESIGNWFKQRSVLSNLFLGISECSFCLENHVATIGAISYAYYCQDIKYLIWGFLCASINSWIRTFTK